MSTIREIAKTAVNFPLEKISNKKSSKFTKILSGMLIFGLTVASLSAYGFYAHQYFKSKKVNPGDAADPTNQKISKTEGKILKGIKTEWTSKLESESTLTEELVNMFSTPQNRSYNFEAFQGLSEQERTFVRDALLSFHQLFEEINRDKQSKGKEWTPTPDQKYENSLYKASFIIPDIAIIALKEDLVPNKGDPTKPNLNLLHFLNSLTNTYMPHAHQDMLGVALARATNSKQLIIFQSIKKNMDKPTAERCPLIISNTIYSREGPLDFVGNKFVKSSSTQI